MSVWYGKLHFLGLKMTIFCHFRTLNYHKTSNKPVILPREVSADVQGLENTKNKYLLLRGSRSLCTDLERLEGKSPIVPRPSPWVPGYPDA